MTSASLSHSLTTVCALGSKMIETVAFRTLLSPCGTNFFLPLVCFATKFLHFILVARSLCHGFLQYSCLLGVIETEWTSSYWPSLILALLCIRSHSTCRDMKVRWGGLSAAISFRGYCHGHQLQFCHKSNCRWVFHNNILQVLPRVHIGVTDKSTDSPSSWISCWNCSAHIIISLVTPAQ